MKTRHGDPGHAGQWQLHEAKNRFSQLVTSAQQDGPQTITLRGKPAVIVVSVEAYNKLTGKPTLPLSKFFAQSPLQGADLDLGRSADLPREVDLR